MTTFNKVRVCGEGTYGVVYEALARTEIDSPAGSDEKTETVQRVAVKRNFAEKSATWTSNIRELDILKRVRGHPFIVNIFKVSIGDPFPKDRPMTPRENRNVKEDKIHFIMEYVEDTCTNYIQKFDVCKPDHIKIMLTQLLLGTEYMHGRNITHRDLKPSNLLVSANPEETIRLRIADFGMSQTLSRSSPPTPGVVTSWYRAPEICCNMPSYGKESDLWSIGCIAFEMFTGSPYLFGVRDDSMSVFSAILGLSSTHFNRMEIDKMMSNSGPKFRITDAAMPIRRIPLKDRIRMCRTKMSKDITGKKLEQFIAEFNTTLGSFDEFVDLVDKLLTINPANRISATQALSHPFFSGMNDYIDAIRQKFNPGPPNLPVVRVVKSIERKWMVEYAFGVYNYRHSLKWYKHRILFHAMDLFDRYIEHCYDNPERLVRDKETPFAGRIHSKSEVGVRFYVLIYLMHKYYSTITYPYQYEEVCPKEFTTSEYLAIAEQFENDIIHEIIQGEIYRDTVLEMPENYGHHVDEKLIGKLLQGYGSITEWNDQSARAMYRSILKLGSDGKPLPMEIDKSVPGGTSSMFAGLNSISINKTFGISSQETPKPLPVPQPDGLPGQIVSAR